MSYYTSADIFPMVEMYSMQNISLPLPMQNEIHNLRMRHPCVYILLYYMQNSLVERELCHTPCKSPVGLVVRVGVI